MAKDYQIAESLNLELDYSDEKSDFRKTNFPARHIYERVLPSIVQQYSDVYYHRSSPYSGFGKDTRDQKYGDLHQCMLPWRSVPYFFNMLVRRERLARITRALAQLGHPCRSLRIRIWHVRFMWFDDWVGKIDLTFIITGKGTLTSVRLIIGLVVTNRNDIRNLGG